MLIRSYDTSKSVSFYLIAVFILMDLFLITVILYLGLNRC